MPKPESSGFLDAWQAKLLHPLVDVHVVKFKSRAASRAERALRDLCGCVFAWPWIFVWGVCGDGGGGGARGVVMVVAVAVIVVYLARGGGATATATDSLRDSNTVIA